MRSLLRDEYDIARAQGDRISQHLHKERFNYCCVDRAAMLLPRPLCYRLLPRGVASLFYILHMSPLTQPAALASEWI